jgi:prepilin-type N-terminal cleavage/methylation domain-containing protein
MNISTKTRRAANARRNAFTLIEMIGVLAVIAILAAVLIPKVFQAINDSRVNNAAMSCQTVKTAIADHYAKFGGLAVDGRATPPTAITLPIGIYDQILVGEAFLDKPFATKIGDGTANTLIEMDTADAVTQDPTAAAAFTPATHIAGRAAFNLDGTGATGVNYNKVSGSAVVYAVITGVTLNDARDLNARIDGASVLLGEGGPGGVATAGAESDISGRVKYTFAAATTTVYVYLTHR